jgi:hypothetical protein
LAGLEGQDATGGNQDRNRALRVATHPVFRVAQDEVTETRDLDLLAALERFLHHVEDGLDDLGSFLLSLADVVAVVQGSDVEELAIDRDRFEVPIQIGIPDDLPRREV